MENQKDGKRRSVEFLAKLDEDIKKAEGFTAVQWKQAIQSWDEDMRRLAITTSWYEKDERDEFVDAFKDGPNFSTSDELNQFARHLYLLNSLSDETLQRLADVVEDRRPNFEISDKVTKEVIYKKGGDPVGIDRYVSSTKKRMEEENWVLFNSIPPIIPELEGNEKFERAYWLAATLTYDSITAQLKKDGGAVNIYTPDMDKYQAMSQEERAEYLREIVYKRAPFLTYYLSRSMKITSQISDDPENTTMGMVLGMKDVAIPLFQKIL